MQSAGFCFDRDDFEAFFQVKSRILTVVTANVKDQGVLNHRKPSDYTLRA